MNPLPMEAAARSLPDVVDRVQVTGETALSTRPGRAVAGIAAVPAERKKVDRMAFLHPWRVAHPEPGDPRLKPNIENARERASGITEVAAMHPP